MNRFDQLDEAGSSCSDRHMDSVDVNVDVNVLSNRIKAVLESKRSTTKMYNTSILAVGETGIWDPSHCPDSIMICSIEEVVIR